MSGAAPVGGHNNSANQAPIFAQFIDCVAQLLRLYPRAFEFSAAFLVDLLDGVHSCRFADWVCNTEAERVLLATHQLPAAWDALADKRASAKGHAHRNPFAADREPPANDVLLLSERGRAPRCRSSISTDSLSTTSFSSGHRGPGSHTHCVVRSVCSQLVSDLKKAGSC